MPAKLLHDNLDDRRELHQLLRRLSPARRIQFAHWACRAATLANSNKHPEVTPETVALAEKARWDTGADERLSREIYWDLWQLNYAYDFDLTRALMKLEAMARQASAR